MTGRNYGIDLLKSVSMCMIIVLHVLGVGGVLAATIPGTMGYNVSWLLETANMCAVNCFGLVSGYVLCRGHYRGSRLLSLWIRVVVEGLLVTAAFAIALPAVVGAPQVIAALSPVLHDVYWYFTAYFALFFFIPFINRMLENLSSREKGIMSLLIILVFSIIGNLATYDIFAVRAGYCFIWLLCLYLMGAFLRTLPQKENLNKYFFLLGYAVCILIAWVIMLISGGQGIIGYTSPLIIAAAACLVLFFRRLEIKSEWWKKTISMLARTSFGVYIIHTHPLIWVNVLAEAFVIYASLSPLLIVPVVLATAVTIYAVCTLGDWLVEKLLKLVRIGKLELAFDKLLKKLLKLGIKAKV